MYTSNLFVQVNLMNGYTALQQQSAVIKQIIYTKTFDLVFHSMRSISAFIQVETTCLFWRLFKSPSRGDRCVTIHTWNMYRTPYDMCTITKHNMCAPIVVMYTNYDSNKYMTYNHIKYYQMQRFQWYQFTCHFTSLSSFLTTCSVLFNSKQVASRTSWR